MIAALLLGCPRTAPQDALDQTALPHLPSPTAGTYAKVPAQPEDLVVRRVLGNHAWDASLGGAAAGLALALAMRTGGITAPEVREAAWRAGWPYPVARAQVWPVTIGEPPPAEIAAWVEAQPPTAALGLVRARGQLQDAWVGLVSEPRRDLGVLPRQLPNGGALALPAVPGAHATVADPAGEVYESSLASGWSVPVRRAGEWLVDVHDDQGPIATFPVYVGILPPELGLLAGADVPADGPAAAALVDLLLGNVREAYGLSAFQADPLLDAAAKAVAADPTIGMDRLVPMVGVDARDLWRWECHSTTAQGCLDAIVWDVQARPGLLAEHGMVGRVADVGPAGVGVVLVVARE